MSDSKKLPLLQVPCPESLLAAVELGARQAFTTKSDYARRALISKLQADGIDPHSTLVRNEVRAP